MQGVHAFSEQELCGGVKSKPLQDILEVNRETLSCAYDLDGLIGVARKSLEVRDTIPGKERPSERPVEPAWCGSKDRHCHIVALHETYALPYAAIGIEHTGAQNRGHVFSELRTWRCY